MSIEVLNSTFADRDFHDATFHKVLGYAEVDGRGVERTPLNVPFREAWLVHSAPLDAEEMLDPKVFNAVGSLVRPDWGGERLHLPVVDVYAGAYVQYERGKHSEAVLKTYSRYPGAPIEEIGDMLGEHGIEVDSSQRTNRLPIGSVALRHARADVFDVVPSTTEGHSHLYINLLFDDDDHSKLVKGLLHSLVVTPPWADIVEYEGMGVVRTPWTKKTEQSI